MRKINYIAISAAFLLLVNLSSAKISVSPRKIKVAEGKINTFETPFVPVISFDSGSADVSAEYNAVLKELAQRLRDNPDAIVEIRGYYHITGDGASGNVSLAKNRSDAVRAKLLEFEPTIASRVLVEPAKNPKKLRRGDDGSLDIKIQQENQRAEITARTSEQMEETFKSTNPNAVVEMLEQDGNLYRFQRMLNDNPLFFLIIEGTNITPADKSVKALKILDIIRSKLVGKIKNDAISERIFISANNDNSKVKKIKISVSPEWIVSKPICQSHCSGVIEPQSHTCRIESDEQGAIGIFRDDGYKIADAHSEWNLSPLPDFSRKYFASMLPNKKSPSAMRVWSKPIEFKNGMQPKSLSESFFLTNYKIDQLEIPNDGASYANRDLAARYIVALANSNRKRIVSVKIAGYTDDTGDDEKNRQMTLFWANKEYEYLANLIEFYSGEKIEKTGKNKAKCKNIEIEIVGMKNADDNPEISESTPQGRIAKRRVEIRVEMK